MKNEELRTPQPPRSSFFTLHSSFFTYSNLLGILVLIAVVLVVFGDLLFTRSDSVVSDFDGDLAGQFLAWRQFGFDNLARGHLALWNPHFYGGAPFLGGFQSALLYPPNWLYMVMPLGRAVNVEVALHVFLAGLWTFCWARRRGFHPAAAVLGAMVFMLGGAHFMHVWAGHLSNLAAMAWIPLIFLAIDQITTADSRRKLWRGAWIGAGAVAMQILAGHPQYVYYTAMIAGPYACLSLLRAPRRNRNKGTTTTDAASTPGPAAPVDVETDETMTPRRPGSQLRIEDPGLRGDKVYLESASSRAACPGVEGTSQVNVPAFWGRVVSLLAMVAVGALLAAGQLLTGLQATAECARSGLDYDTAKTFPFAPENLLTLVAPDFFGDLSNVHYWGRWVLWEQSFFVGVAAFSLAVYGAVAAERRARRFSVLMIALALVLALGSYTPLHRALYLHLPGFGSFRGACKFIVLAALFVSMLTAAGLDRLLRACAEGSRGARTSSSWPVGILLAAAIVSAGLGAAIWRSATVGRQEGMWVAAMSRINFADVSHHWTPWVAGENLNPRVMLTFFVKSGLCAAQSLFWCGGTCLVVAATWWLARRRRIAVYGLAFLAAIELCVFARECRGSFRLSPFLAHVAALGQELAPITPQSRVSGISAAAVMMAGGYTIDGNDPMILRRYAEFSNWALSHASADQPSGLWRLLRLQYQPERTPPFRLTRLPWQTLAQVQLVPRYRVVSDASQAFALMAKPEFDPRQTVLLEAPVGDVPINNPPDSQAGSVEMTAISTDEMEIRATTPRAAILLISDNYASEWKVRSLQEDPPQSSYQIVRGDYILRAIPLAAGTHHLRLEYRPSGWMIGRWISLAALVVFAAWGAVGTLWIFRSDTQEKGIRNSLPA